MVLAECAGREVDIDAGDRFDGRCFAGESNHAWAENRITSLRLCIEKEPLKSIAEALLDGFR